MILAIECKSVEINNILYIVRSIMNIIMIIAPILAIIFLAILLTKKVMDPDEKKLTSKIKNTINALVIVFFIPTIINVTMYMLGNKTDFSSCYTTAQKLSQSTSYLPVKDNEGKTKLIDEKKYEKGFVHQLDFSCKSKHLNAQFSCETIHKVEHHLNDFNDSNFQSVIASYDGFKNYAKTIGGIFYDYYGEELKVTKAVQFQRVSEYVFGYMTMFGFDYYNGVDGMDINDVLYCKWGGACMQMADYEKAVAEAEKKSKETGKHVEPDIEIPTSSSDAFYPGQYLKINHGTFPGASFDKGIAGNNMTTNCNNSVDMVYTKANILGTKERPYLSSQWEYQIADKKNKIISEFKDLQIGDIVHFFDQPVDSSDPSTWGNWAHIAYVGEIDYVNDVITMYDGGSGFVENRNYKWTIDRKKTTKHLGSHPGWGAVRVVDLT